MKILHIATDEKFIDYAVPIFEAAYPGCNTIVVFSRSKTLRFVKTKPVQIEVVRWQFAITSARLRRSFYEKFDVVVIHSLNKATYPEVGNIPKEKAILWIGWGFDYYNDIISGMRLLLPETEHLLKQKASRHPILRMREFIRSSIRAQRVARAKIRAIERVSVFCPVLPNEYGLVSQSRRWKAFPALGSWNYGTIEDDLLKGFTDREVRGDGILVGNSATPTGNHIEALRLLRDIGTERRDVVLPLSYGDGRYRDELIKLGKIWFGASLQPIYEFVEIEKYINIISKCGYVIMNHVRQQAVGNIVIMLYLGARVFLREESPTFSFFREMGVTLSTVQDLRNDPTLLQRQLGLQEKAKNRELVQSYWSRENACKRTIAVVNKAIEISCRP